MIKIIQLILELFRTKRRRPGKERYITNLKPSPNDARDGLYSVSTAFVPPMPKYVDHSQYCTPVKQQGRIGSCGSHAFATALEMRMKKKEAKSVVPLSELFHYYVVRDEDYMNTFPEDSGQFLRDGAKVCQKMGVSPEKLCRYDSNKYNKKPSLFAYSFAKFFKIGKYRRCWNLDSIKQSIADLNCIIGIFVHDSIITTGKSGNVTGKGIQTGGHAICAIGFNDEHKNPDGTLGAIKFVNSWGERWGNTGYGWISYNLLKKNLIEAWMVT